MKNVFKTLGNLNQARSAKVPLLIIALVAVIGFSFAVLSLTGCDNGGGGGGGNNPGENPGSNTFTSVPDMTAWLTNQPANTPNSPYNIKLNVSSLEGMGGLRLEDYVGGAVYSRKFVNLDLSGSTFTSIGSKVFWECQLLISVIIGNSVTSIGSQAFSGCSQLTNVTIPNSVLSIGDGAFVVCKFNSVTIPNSVTSIGNSAFSSCKNLTNITIPNSVTRIGILAFNNCTKLTSVTFQGTITAGNLPTLGSGSSITTSFEGDLRDKYLAGGPGTYTTTTPVPAVEDDWKPVWTKQ